MKQKLIFKHFGNVFLLVIVVLIVGNAVLIYYMVNSPEYIDKYATNSIEQQNSIQQGDAEEVDTIANILNTVVSNSTSTNTTISSNDANTKKVLNEDLIVLYNGLILDTTKMDEIYLNYIDNNSLDKDKYVITYYNYENFAYQNSSLGQLTDPIYENAIGIENVGKIAISEDYNAIPRDVKIINTIPQIVLDNNSKLNEYDSVKTVIADLDGNGLEEYVIIMANKSTGYSKISLYDSNGDLVSDLAYIEKSKWNQTTNIEYYLSLDNVNILDVDNDDVMEILVEIPKYEGQPSVSLLKYKNNELTGKTNIECSLLP